MSRRPPLLVPSLFFMLQVAAAVLAAYSRFPGGAAGLAAGMAAAVLSMVLLPFIIKSTFPGGADAAASEGSRRVKRSLACTVLVIASAATASSVYFRARALADFSGFDPGSAPFHCSIKEVHERRYDIELEVRVLPASTATGTTSSGYDAAVYAPRGAAFRRGDRFDLCARPLPIDRARLVDSPFMRSMARRGLRCSFHAGEGDIIFTCRAPAGRLERLRGDLESRIGALFPRDTASLLQALYFGNSSRVDKGTISDYRRSGVLHILAASGFNIAIVAAVPFLIMAPFRVRKKAILPVCALCVTAYLCLTDMPVSLLRAFIMFAVCAIQRLIDGDRNAMNALFIAATVLLFLFPDELYSLGFQLSFGATAGIIMLQRTYRSALGGMPGPLADSIALTLSAQAPVFPVIALTLGEVNLTGILSNLVMVPAISVVFVAGASAVLLDAVHPASGHFLAVAVGWITGACGTFARGMASMGGHYRVAGLMPLLLVPYALYLAPALSPLLRKTGVPLIAAALVSSAALLHTPDTTAERIAFMTSPKSRGALYARGGSAVYCGTLGDAGDAAKIICFFRDHALDRLDLHIAGGDGGSLAPVIRLIRNTTVRRCVISPASCTGRKLAEFAGAIDTDGIRLEVANVPVAEKLAGMPAAQAAETMRPLVPAEDATVDVREVISRTVNGLFRRTTGEKKEPVEVMTL